MAKGGKRKGAGRKKGFKALAAEVARELLIERVTEEWTPLIEAQLQLALGVTVVDDESIYSKPPDRAAIEYLINQVAGKPKETHEIGGKDGNPIPVQIIDFTTYKPTVVTD